RVQRVVIAGHDDDGLAKPTDLAADELDQLVGHAVVIEQIAGDQHQVDGVRQRAIDDGAESAASAGLVRRLLSSISIAVAAEMHVCGVEDAERSSRCGHAAQYATAARIPRRAAGRSGEARDGSRSEATRAPRHEASPAW